MTSPCVHSSPPQRNVTDPDACYDLTLKEAHASSCSTTRTSTSSSSTPAG